MSRRRVQCMAASMSLLFLFVRGQSNEQYLPLKAGNRWVLRSHAVAKPIVLEVLRADSSAALLRFDNPWLSSQLRLIARDGRYYVETLIINGQAAQMPPDTLYWDLAAPEKQRWSSAIGNLEVLSRRRTVLALGRSFKDCVEIQETNKQGNKLFWIFAAGVGFVQFGEGKDAFVLESFSGGHDSGISASSATEPSREQRPSPQTRRAAAIRVALGANPFANEPYGPEAVRARFRQARDAGINLIYISPKWNEIETGRGKYKFDDIRFQIGEAAEEDLPAILQIRVIDTNQRSMPGDLAQKPLDGPEVTARLESLLDAVFPLLQGRVKYFLIGNEIDGYFKQHPGETRAYARLAARAAAKIKSKVPDAQISVSSTFDGLSLWDSLLRPIADQIDFLALTYYPLTPDFVVRDPSVVDSDFRRTFSAAGAKKIFLQEIGYPTSPVNQSSEEKQAELFSRALDAVAANPDRFIGINFTFMSDFSDSLVKSFAAYYNMPGAERFRAYLKTLGMFDDRGRPKKSWDVFVRKVRSLT